MFRSAAGVVVPQAEHARLAGAIAAVWERPQPLPFESQMMTLTGATQDHRTAVDAFLAKEKPTFTGS